MEKNLKVDTEQKSPAKKAYKTPQVTETHVTTHVTVAAALLGGLALLVAASSGGGGEEKYPVQTITEVENVEIISTCDTISSTENKDDLFS